MPSTPRLRNGRPGAAGVAPAAAPPAGGAGVRGEPALLGIGQLCAEFGVSPRTLRFYESKGLLAPQRVGTTRVYDRRDRARLALVLRSKAIGASLEEIRHFLDLYGEHGEGRVRQMRWVMQRTDAAIAQLEARREAIETTLAELRAINGSVRQRLKARRA